MEHSERDRHLPEDVTRLPLTDHTLHAVDPPQHLEPPRQNTEQRPPITLVHRELVSNERDVPHHPGKPLELGRLDIREHREPPDLIRRHHERRRRRCLAPAK